MRIAGGNTEIADCLIGSLNLAKEFISISSQASNVRVRNSTVHSSNVSSNGFINVLEQHDESNIPIKILNGNNLCITVASCNFTNITASGNNSVIFFMSSFPSIECVLDSCFWTNCISEISEEGGAAKVCLNCADSSLKLVSCMIVQCACSRTKGKGGGLMIDCVPSSTVIPSSAQLIHSSSRFLSSSQSNEHQSFHLAIVNDRFIGNDALIGKDIFIRCTNIREQLNETQFTLDFTQSSLQTNNSICACEGLGPAIVDIIPFITFFKAGQIHASLNGTDSSQCGSLTTMCKTISNAALHIDPGSWNMIVVHSNSTFSSRTTLSNLSIKSMSKEQCKILLASEMQTIQSILSLVNFVDDCSLENCFMLIQQGFVCNYESILQQINGILLVYSCTFFVESSSLVLNSSFITVASGQFEITKCSFSSITTTKCLIEYRDRSTANCVAINITRISSEDHVFAFNGRVKTEIKELNVQNTTIGKALLSWHRFDAVDDDDNCKLQRSRSNSFLKIAGLSFENVNHTGNGACAVECLFISGSIAQQNCSFKNCSSKSQKGKLHHFKNCDDIIVEWCSFQGCEVVSVYENTANDDVLCKWNGSLIDSLNTNAFIKDSSIMYAPSGGLSVSGGVMLIEMGLFSQNYLPIPGYESARRNILCSQSGLLDVKSIRDEGNTINSDALWILNDGCTLGGIAGERESPFFIPKLESALVVGSEAEEYNKIRFKGSLFLPCGLSFGLTYTTGDEKLIEKYDFNEDGFISEGEVECVIHSSNLTTALAETEVAVSILFGNPSFPSKTESFILKNRSEPKQKEEEKSVESGKGVNSLWIIIVVSCIVFIVLLLIIVAVTIRWRKQKRRTEELEVIVNDTVKKDPKAFEMVTMEMSPEEQWRRAEREAEKKNEERIKKRVYETNMEHSESSEHLLSESGSTEYILGKDSDKIPEWVLEKVDDEEETRKRSPSPSISSTSTTDTSDTESTFVRGEDLCPTTSSMSNLVDAMACSSPHEKLIVDLRDSLFMLLHGRNKTKEMAIGSLKEREMTAAQILFWVANLALHSFDEENELPSLTNLSPHIVLFSEHMVICIALHSDCSSDSDTSSISSSTSTIVTSSSDVSVKSERFSKSPPPSSAFEDEDDFKKECLRWKAPELLINKKMGATKKTVAFSIGMMLWESLTLEIPFGEYEAVIAGDKITKGERPKLDVVQCSAFYILVKNCVSQSPSARPSLFELKRDFITHFPSGAAILTVTDAIGFENATDNVDGSETLIDSEIRSTQTET